MILDNICEGWFVAVDQNVKRVVNTTLLPPFLQQVPIVYLRPD